MLLRVPLRCRSYGRGRLRTLTERRWKGPLPTRRPEGAEHEIPSTEPRTNYADLGRPSLGCR